MKRRRVQNAIVFVLIIFSLLTSKVSTSLENRGEKIQSVVNWFRKNSGFIVNGITAKRVHGEADNGYGYYADERLTSGDTLIQLPDELLVRIEPDLSEIIGSRDPVLLLAVQLSQLPDFWEAYVNSLPWTSIPRVPVVCSSTDFERIQQVLGNSSLLVEWVQYIKYVEQWYFAISEQLPIGTLEHWKNTIAIVLSRAHRAYSIEDRNEEVALFPIVDLLNYSQEPNVRCDTNIARSLVECIALRSIEAGEQLLVGYGEQGTTSRLRMVFNYGFLYDVEASIVSDEFCIPLEMVQACMVEYEEIQHWKDSVLLNYCPWRSSLSYILGSSSHCDSKSKFMPAYRFQPLESFA